MLGLLDSGASRTIIGGRGWKVLRDIGLLKLDKTSLSKVTVANGNTCRCIGVLHVECVEELGCTNLVEHKIELIGEVEPIKQRYYPVSPEPIGIYIAVMQNMFRRLTVPVSEEVKLKILLQFVADVPVDSVDALRSEEVLSTKQASILSELVESHFNSSIEELGCTNLVEHKIELIGEVEPIKQRYYPVSPAIIKQMDTVIKDMLDKGVIEPSSSPWSSPVVMVPKRDGTWRFCVDYRQLNKVTKRDAYPLPYISSILDRLRDARYLSSLDVKSAYWQIPVAEDSRPLTAFTVPGRGLFQFKRLPFGLHTAPATWQRLIDRVLGVDLEPYCFKYLDDIIITTQTFEQHIEVLSKVFKRIRSAGLTLGRDKCKFCRSELGYLGYVVDRNGLHVDPGKVEAILRIPIPTKVQEVRSLIGTASWYRRFIPNFASVIEPLTMLLRKGVKFEWTEAQRRSFDEIKERLVSAPVLSCPDFSLPFTIQTDASAFGLGAVLTQEHPEQGERVICYLSRSLSRQERNFSTTERECLAVLWSIDKLRPYVEGSHFKVITDHWSLRWLNNLKNPTGRLARWSLQLQQYSFDVVHRKGKDHAVPDMLSRSVLIVDSISVNHPQVIDRWYENMKRGVAENPLKFPSWRVEDSKVYKFVHSREVADLQIPDEWKIVVPKFQRMEVLQACHDSPHAGHPGVFKTFNRVAQHSQHYYWPKMKSDISRYVGRCTVCNENKPEQRKPAGFTAKRRIVDRPFQVVSCDFIGPLPRSTRGYKYILVIVDLFSKFTLAIPLRSATTKLCWAAIEDQLFLMFGQPMTLISDNGVQFRSREFTNLLQSYRVQHVFTPNYHAQANPTERTNKTLETMVRCYVKDNHRSWDKHLRKIACAIRTQVHESTGYTPYSIVFGREFPLNLTDYIKLSRDLAVDENALRTDRTIPLRSLYAEVKRRLEKAAERNKRYYDLRRRDVQYSVGDRGRLEKAAERNKRYYDLRRRDVQYSVGDRVFRRNFVQSDALNYFAAKLAPKFVGPFVIKKKISPWTCELEDTDGRFRGNWHCKDLKPSSD
ncbi:Reverse transcriptase (RNA-dependent DNA polymerase) [Popillia japonica]|uniref:RNA-directed DNA polymerase n=1 Tax=Popillia japonica TaxID=7064 RepID=A0AAW1IEK8_POPJA